MGVGSSMPKDSGAIEESGTLVSIAGLESNEKTSIVTAESNEKALTEIKVSSAKVSKACKSISRKYISAKLRREILSRAGYRCCYTDSISGRGCEQRHGLQIEHKVPISLGGSDSPENLEILCSNHNKLRAVQKLGVTMLKHYIPSLT